MTEVDAFTSIVERVDLPCGFAGHETAQGGCAPGSPAVWVVQFVHGEPKGPCVPFAMLVCDGRADEIRHMRGHEACCRDCGLWGVFGDFVRVIERI